MTRETTWRTSSFSAPNNDCVELAHSPTGTSIRDTKNRAGGTLRFGPAAFVTLLGIVKEQPPGQQTTT